jgi:hypothetical protein
MEGKPTSVEGKPKRTRRESAAERSHVLVAGRRSGERPTPHFPEPSTSAT